MRFFEHQAQARSHTVKLVLLYAAAMAATVAALAWVSGWFFSSSPDKTNYYFFASLVFAAAMLAASRYRLRELSQGGHVVAEALGGKRIRHEDAGPGEKRLLNVVDEMALAAMMPKPKVYLLPDAGINAFAAGMGGKDAVIGITKGAVDALDRAELQAVVAHEFSHIANGDMRLNMRLTGWLFGLQMISVCGKYLMFGTRFSLSGDKRTAQGEAEAAVAGCLGSLPFTLLGLTLLVTGSAGALFAGWIQAAICRQREYLADASAVQFTRQTEGMAGALYKTAVAPRHKLLSWHAAEYAHFMFGSVREPDIFDRLAATHPRIIDRIRRLSPPLAKQWQREIAAAESHAGRQAHGHGGILAFSAAEQEQRWAEAQADALLLEQQQRADAMRARIGRQRPDYAERCRRLAQHAPGVWLVLAANGERAALVAQTMLAGAAVQTASSGGDALNGIFLQRLLSRNLPAAHYPDMLEYLLPHAVAESGGADKLLQRAQAAYRANPQPSLTQQCVWQLLNAYLYRPSERQGGASDAQAQIVAQTAALLRLEPHQKADFEAFQTALSDAASWPQPQRGQVFQACASVLAQSGNRAAAELLRHTLAVSLDIAVSEAAAA